MSRNRIPFILFCLVFLSDYTYGQDTIRLEKRPKIIIKSWYPEFKEFPKLKIGERKILFTIIPALEKTSIRDNDIDLIASNDQVQIEETAKSNQYLITVNSTTEKFIEFELWFAIENKTIQLKHDSKWEDIRRIYPVKGNRILIDKVKLELVK